MSSLAPRAYCSSGHVRAVEERPDSDYDLIIVSPRFTHIRAVNRSLGASGSCGVTSAAMAPIDLICLTPDEFETARHRITLVAEVLPEAVDLLADGEARVNATNAEAAIPH